MEISLPTRTVHMPTTKVLLALPLLSLALVLAVGSIGKHSATKLLLAHPVFGERHTLAS